MPSQYRSSSRVGRVIINVPFTHEGNNVKGERRTTVGTLAEHVLSCRWSWKDLLTDTKLMLVVAKEAARISNCLGMLMVVCWSSSGARSRNHQVLIANDPLRFLKLEVGTSYCNCCVRLPQCTIVCYLPFECKIKSRPNNFFPSSRNNWWSSYNRKS